MRNCFGMKFLGKKIIGGILLLGIPCMIYSLPTVESRTGEPVVRASNHNNPPNPPQEDHNLHHTLTQMEALKQEISELRGLIEVQDHELKQLKKSQQDLYLDLDKRVAALQQAQAKQIATANSAEMADSKKIQIVIKPKAEVKDVKQDVKPELKDPKNVAATKVVAQNKTNDVSTSTQLVQTSQNKATPDKTVPEQKPLTEKEAYDAAYKLLGSKQYSEAVLALQNFLNNFPKGNNVPNAHYWLGELYMIQWQVDKNNNELLNKATQSFSVVAKQFPTHPKASDALLKLGLAEIEKGESTSAKETLLSVIDRFPGTTAARIAETRLQQLAND